MDMWLGRRDFENKKMEFGARLFRLANTQVLLDLLPPPIERRHFQIQYSKLAESILREGHGVNVSWECLQDSLELAATDFFDKYGVSHWEAIEEIESYFGRNGLADEFSSGGFMLTKHIFEDWEVGVVSTKAVMPEIVYLYFRPKVTLCDRVIMYFTGVPPRHLEFLDVPVGSSAYSGSVAHPCGRIRAYTQKNSR